MLAKNRLAHMGFAEIYGIISCAFVMKVGLEKIAAMMMMNVCNILVKIMANV